MYQFLASFTAPSSCVCHVSQLFAFTVMNKDQLFLSAPNTLRRGAGLRGLPPSPDRKNKVTVRLK